MPQEQVPRTQTEGDDPRPFDRDSYLRWLRESFGVEVEERLETRFDTVVNKVRRDFEHGELWRRICSELNNLDSEYRLRAQNYPLFLAGADPPELTTKSFGSYLLKTFRRNVSENDNWPEPPGGDWVLPGSGFCKVNDLVRTTFVVKYLDGVEFLAEQLRSISIEDGCRCSLDFEARNEGHYAAHLCIERAFQVPGDTWEAEEATFAVEIQIITQLQEVIKRLTHKFYERRRKKPTQPLSKWQWDYKSDEFTANYLGHILHYVEGMIMEVRTNQDNTNGDRAWSEQI